MTAPLSEQQLAEIRAREAAATKGPWRTEDDTKDLNRWVLSEDSTLAIGFGYVGNRTQDDAAFIAHARQDVPALLAEVERLWKQADVADECAKKMATRLHDRIAQLTAAEDRIRVLEAERHTTNESLSTERAAELGDKGESAPGTVEDPAEPDGEDEPEPDSPARRAAREIQALHDPIVIGYVVCVNALRIVLRPNTWQEWQGWQRRLGAEPGGATYRGGTATAHGTWGDVPVTVSCHLDRVPKSPAVEIDGAS